MSLQEMPCLEGALCYRGAFNMMQDSIILQAFISTLEEHFVTPQANWEKINAILGLYGMSKFLNQGSPSKNEDLGDGTKSIWQSPSSNMGCMVTTFDAFEKLGLLSNPDECRITFNAQPKKEELKAMTWWKAVFSKYKVAKEKEMNMMISGYTIASFHNSNSMVSYSPAQIAMFRNPLTGTSIGEPGPCGTNGWSVLAKVPWDTTNKYLASVMSALASPWKQSFGSIEKVDIEYEVKITSILLSVAQTAGQTIDDPEYVAPSNPGVDDGEGGTVPDPDWEAPAIPQITLSPIPASGLLSGDIFCVEKMPIVRTIFIPDPSYIPEELGEAEEGEDPPEPDPDYPVQVSLERPVPPCFAEYGSRPDDPNLAYDYYAGSFIQEDHFCGSRIVIHPKYWPEEANPLVEPPEPEEGEDEPVLEEDAEVLTDGCPYMASCKSPSCANPRLLDYVNQKFNFGWPNNPTPPITPAPNANPPVAGDPEYMWSGGYIQDYDFIKIWYRTVKYKE